MTYMLLLNCALILLKKSSNNLILSTMYTNFIVGDFEVYSAFPFCIKVPISDLFAFLCLLSFRLALSFVPWSVCLPRLVFPAAVSRADVTSLIGKAEREGALSHCVVFIYRQ